MKSDNMDENFNEHYFSPDPKSKLIVKDVLIKLKNGHEYSLRSPSGVFAFGKANRATIVFLENIRLKKGSVLDLGCGYGVVGTVMAKEYPYIKVFMSDINKRAVRFAKENALKQNLDLIVREGDLYEPWQGMKFDTILFNPPMAAGKKVWIRAIKESELYLEENGNIQIVAYHNKGGARIKEFMKKIYGNAKTIVKSGGIRVYKSEK
jgi:16S rRNA G1207 methylase RsmC